MAKLQCHPVPAGAVVRTDYKVRVKLDGTNEWQELVNY